MASKAETDKAGIGYWLGSSSKIANRMQSDFDILELGEAGIAKSAADRLAMHLGISRKLMAEEILDVSVKTMERKQPSDKLDKRVSAHVLEIARLMKHAYAVFEDADKVQQWLNRESAALKGRRPFSLLHTITGINMANAMLTRIEEGVYS